MTELPKHSILTDPHVGTSMKYPTIQTINEVARWCFSSPNNGRSTVKTHMLHSGIRKIIEASLGTYESAFYEQAKFVSEQFGSMSGGVMRQGKRFDKAMGKQFQADLFIAPQVGDGSRIAFSVKMPIQSIAKNNVNYINSVLGEAVQFFGAPQNSNNYLVFYNIRPRTCFRKDAGKLHVEKPTYFDVAQPDGRLHPDFKNALSPTAYRNTRIVNIYYDWARDINLHSCASEYEFYKLIEGRNDLGVDLDSIRHEGMKSLAGLILDVFSL